MAETAVGVRELKARLSAYLRRVKRGESIVVTEHGRPIGRLVPLGDSVSERLAALGDAGLLEWSGNPLATAKPSATVRADRSVSDLVVEGRE